MIDTMIGVDLAKNVFQLHGASLTGEVKFRKKLSRPQFRKFMEDQPPSIVVFESCGGAHFWTREMQQLGHQAKLIAPQYVKPFVKRQKNDAADAEAIVIAAQRPEMRFVEPKTTNRLLEALCSVPATAWCASELSRSMRFEPFFMNRARYSRRASIR